MGYEVPPKSNEPINGVDFDIGFPKLSENALQVFNLPMVLHFQERGEEYKNSQKVD